MDLFAAIAALCMVSSGGEKGPIRMTHRIVAEYQLECQQSYLHCYNLKLTKPATTDREAMTKCILEKKL
jgi:hypothetical protein